MSKEINLVTLPQSFIDFQDELCHHPELSKRLQEETDGFLQVFEAVAARFNILLDGMYTIEDIAKLADLLTRKLRESRIPIISSVSSEVIHYVNQSKAVN